MFIVAKLLDFCCLRLFCFLGRNALLYVLLFFFYGGLIGLRYFKLIPFYILWFIIFTITGARIHYFLLLFFFFLWIFNWSPFFKQIFWFGIFPTFLLVFIFSLVLTLKHCSFLRIYFNAIRIQLPCQNLPEYLLFILSLFIPHYFWRSRLLF